MTLKQVTADLWNCAFNDICVFASFKRPLSAKPNDGLQLRRAISIEAEGMKLLEKHAVAPSAARLCSAALPT
jgi:hypothetical protein